MLKFSSPTGPMPPVSRALSLNHWDIREVPVTVSLIRSRASLPLFVVSVVYSLSSDSWTSWLIESRFVSLVLETTLSLIPLGICSPNSPCTPILTASQNTFHSACIHFWHCDPCLIQEDREGAGTFCLDGTFRAAHCLELPLSQLAGQYVNLSNISGVHVPIHIFPLQGTFPVLQLKWIFSLNTEPLSKHLIKFALQYNYLHYGSNCTSSIWISEEWNLHLKTFNFVLSSLLGNRNWISISRRCNHAVKSSG